MALVAKMVAGKIEQYGNGRYVACSEDDDGAIAIDDPKSPTSNVYTDPPEWLITTGWVRMESNAQSQENIELRCVAQPAGTDPDRTNAKWANASPSGQLTMVLCNPEGFGYIKAGREYRVTIEEIQPAKRRLASNTTVLTGSDGQQVYLDPNNA